jgi:hypothetical protein
MRNCPSTEENHLDKVMHIVDLTEMLREVRDEGLIYWEPNTERGHVAKADMIARISRLIGDS